MKPSWKLGAAMLALCLGILVCLEVAEANVPQPEPKPNQCEVQLQLALDNNLMLRLHYEQLEAKTKQLYAAYIQLQQAPRHCPGRFITGRQDNGTRGEGVGTGGQTSTED